MSSFNCEKCGTPIIDTEYGYKTVCGHYTPGLAYDERHDAWYVIKTGRWTESKCSDQNCGYCKDRPDTANASFSRGAEAGEARCSESAASDS